MTDDAELLRHYAADHSEAAFREIVHRHLSLVYHAALRRCGGDSYRAQEVAQQVFTDLARKAGALAGHTALAGWLYTSTHYAAAQFVRTEVRRQQREREAQVLNTMLADSVVAADWDRVRPVIDDALRGLGERDRAAVLLRFFEGCAYAEVAAQLKVTEDAARMRVDRAVEKMRSTLARRGVTSTAAALSAALASQAGAAVPPLVIASVTQGALAAGIAGTGAVAWLTFMSITKIQAGVGIALLAAMSTGLVLQQRTNAQLRAEVAELQVKMALDSQRAGANSRPAAAPSVLSEVVASTTGEPAAGATSPASGKMRPVAATPTRVPLAAGLVPIETLGNSGRATARSAFATQLWAARTGDVELEASSLTFGPEARATLEALEATLPAELRAEYNTPEKLMAFILAGSPHPVGGMQVLGETAQGSDDITLQTEWQHVDDDQVVHSDVQFHRDADGWKFVVPLRLVNRAAAYLTRSQLAVPATGKKT